MRITHEEKARRLVFWRLKWGFTQPQMAKLLGIGKDHYSKMERGQNSISRASLRLFEAYVEGYRPDDWPKRSPTPFTKTYPNLNR